MSSWYFNGLRGFRELVGRGTYVAFCRSMAHPSNNESTNEIIERATAVSLGEAQSAHPMVLSCGGVFVPRPRRLNPRDPLYVILHTPATEMSTKIVSACASKGLLDVAQSKERLN